MNSLAGSGLGQGSATNTFVSWPLIRGFKAQNHGFWAWLIVLLPSGHAGNPLQNLYQESSSIKKSQISCWTQNLRQGSKGLFHSLGQVVCMNLHGYTSPAGRLVISATSSCEKCYSGVAWHAGASAVAILPVKNNCKFCCCCCWCG